MDSELGIRVMKEQDLPMVEAFSNRIWPNSFNEGQLPDLFYRSQLNGFTNAHVVFAHDELVGYRLGLAPGKW